MEQTLRKASAVVLLLITSSVIAAGPPRVRYAVTDLGRAVLSLGMNSRGEVVGIFHGGDGRYHGFVASGGEFTDIGSLGGNPTFARQINSAGDIVGSSITPRGEEHAFLKRDGVMMDLGTLGGTYSHANDINDAGVIVGDAETHGQGGGHGDMHASLWENGRVVDLGTLGGAFSEANAVNERGHVVGWAWDEQWDTRPFFWSAGGGMIDLGDLGGGEGSASDVNSLDEVVGSSRTPGGLRHATLWREGGIVDLGVLPEAGKQGPYGPELVETHATAINDAGQIVGNSFPAFEQAGPFLWENGEMVNLNRLINPSSGWVISVVNDINERGQIAATARGADGFYHAVLLSPVRVSAVSE